MKFGDSCRFSSLILCLACLLSFVGAVWADEGDPIVDEDGDIIVQINGKPALGQVSDDMPTIMFEATLGGPCRVDNANMWSAPTMMVLCDSEGAELGRNVKDDDIDAFVTGDLKQGKVYFVIVMALQDEDHGKPFSISVKTTASPVTPVSEKSVPEVSVSPMVPAAPVTRIQGPLALPQGIEVGANGVSYEVTRDEQGRVSVLDDGAGDRILVEYRYPDETPGLDVWYSDGTFSSFDFFDTYNKISKGRYGEPPSVVMLLDRETGKQVTKLADGTVITAEPQADGQMEVTTRLLGQAAIRSTVDSQGQWSQVGSRVVRDEKGRPVKVVRGGHILTSTRYNDQDQPVEVTLASGKKIQYQYDTSDRLTQTTDVYGGKTQYEYVGDDGQQVRTTLPDGAVEVKTYDAQNRILESVGPGGDKAKLRYAGDYLVGVTLEGLDTQVYLPFEKGNLSLAKSSLTGNWLFEKQDADDLSVRRLDPLGKAVVFSYSEQGFLTGVQDDEGRSLNRMAYDENANLTSIRTPNTQVDRTYDEHGQILKETSREGQMSIEYTYDDQGIVTRLTDSKGGDTTYLRDEQGQLSEIQSVPAGSVKLAYGPFGLLETLERPNGVTTTWQYDDGGRLSGCSHTGSALSLSSQYRYNARGQLIKITREPGDDTTLTRDAAGHWTGVNEGGEDSVFKFDAWGQVLQAGSFRFNYDQTGHLNALEVIGADTTLPVTCDAVGRVVKVEMSGTTVTNGFDWDHRLIHHKNSDQPEGYAWTYDGLGRLATASGPAEGQLKTQNFVYSFDRLYAVSEQAALDQYVMIPGTLLCVAVVTADNTVYFPIWDHQGSITHLTDTKGESVAQRTYSVTGAVVGDDDMPIAMGYRGGLRFVSNSLVFLKNKAIWLGTHRPAAATAPWPRKSSLRSASPFVVSENEEVQ